MDIQLPEVSGLEVTKWLKDDAELKTIPVVAVTGSNGKTTTKEMVAAVLAARWTTLKTEGNLNNRIGVPQTLLRLTARHKAAVIEMGVDARGQTTRLCEIVRPTVGIITNIGADHLEFFGDLEGSAQAKAELLARYLVTGAELVEASTLGAVDVVVTTGRDFQGVLATPNAPPASTTTTSTTIPSTPLAAPEC